MDIFSALNEEGITVVMVTHEPDMARRSRRIIWFLDGQVLQAYLTPADIGQIAVS